MREIKGPWADKQVHERQRETHFDMFLRFYFTSAKWLICSFDDENNFVGLFRDLLFVCQYRQNLSWEQIKREINIDIENYIYIIYIYNITIGRNKTQLSSLSSTTTWLVIATLFSFFSRLIYSYCISLSFSFFLLVFLISSTTRKTKITNYTQTQTYIYIIPFLCLWCLFKNKRSSFLLFFFFIFYFPSFFFYKKKFQTYIQSTEMLQ